MSTPIMPGAEPLSVSEGSQGGVLLLHGYTATPQQIRPWAMAFAQAGFAVEAPLLPGHGTIAEEMIDTRWSDYMDCAEAAYRKLAAHHQRVLVGGLCLGGTIAASLAMQHSTTTSGLILINSYLKSPRGGNAESIGALLKSGKQFFSWPSRPKQVEDPQAPAILSYDKVAIAPMPSLGMACIEIMQRIDEVHCPVLVFTSMLDPEANLEDRWFDRASGPVEHILLARSNHVATLDYDKGVIEERSIAFAHAVIDGKRERLPLGATW